MLLLRKQTFWPEHSSSIKILMFELTHFLHKATPLARAFCVRKHPLCRLPTSLTEICKQAKHGSDNQSSKSFTKLKNKVFLSYSFNEWLSLQLNSEENSVWLLFMVILCLNSHREDDETTRKSKHSIWNSKALCDLVQEQPNGRSCSWTVPNAILNHKKGEA